jgi:hypothetical protein
MMNFITQPIFFLTPYIFGWSLLNGAITVLFLKLFKLNTSRQTKIATGLATAIASIFWNWSIEFNRSTIYLNVDHPIFRISWADALNGVCVFALNCLVLGLWIDRHSLADRVIKIAGIAAIITIFTDTFLF